MRVVSVSTVLYGVATIANEKEDLPDELSSEPEERLFEVVVGLGGDLKVCVSSERGQNREFAREGTNANSMVTNDELNRT